MFVYSSLILIGGLQFTFCSELIIKSTWQEMTSTATITFPKKALVRTKEGNLIKLHDLVKVGDQVQISLGYNGILNTEFVGYVVKSPRPSVPVEIVCEDEMWKLKNKKVIQQVFSNAKLSTLIKSVLPEYEVDLYDTELGTNYSSIYEATGTAAGMLKKVEDTFGLKSFFRLIPTENGFKNVLVIGRPYSSNDLQGLNPVIFRLKLTTKADSLEYKFKEDEPIQVKGISKIDNGKDLKSTYPVDEAFEGSTKTVHYSVTTQAELDKLVKDDWTKINADRFEGSVTGFAKPYARHGMVAQVIDSNYEAMNTFNYIDEVEIKVDVNGGVQRICKLGYVANEQTREATR